MTYRRWISAFVIGALFGAGLVVSGMTDPNKVIGFLDFTGDWDPSLVFVLAGAVAPNLFLFRRILKQSKPKFDTKFHLPSQTKITAKLIVGSALFGVGWGLSGYCPGPAVVAASGAGIGLAGFLAAMLLSAGIYRAFTDRTQGSAPAAASTELGAVLP